MSSSRRCKKAEQSCEMCIKTEGSVDENVLSLVLGFPEKSLLLISFASSIASKCSMGWLRVKWIGGVGRASRYKTPHDASIYNIPTPTRYYSYSLKKQAKWVKMKNVRCTRVYGIVQQCHVLVQAYIGTYCVRSSFMFHLFHVSCFISPLSIQIRD